MLKIKKTLAMALATIMITCMCTSAFASEHGIVSQNEQNTVVSDECIIVINDVEMQSMSETEVNSILQDMMHGAKYGDNDRSAANDEHSCSSIGPYAYRYGRWNFVYYSDGTPWYDVRMVLCISDNCTYLDYDYRYH